MTFPQTRLSLIQRLAVGDAQEDWAVFLHDYWGPVCRFALRWGARNLEDAEDVAAETFRVLWENRLLARWTSNRSAKLRTMLCSVVRNHLSNRGRVAAARERLAEAPRIEEWTKANPTDDLFYAAWAEDVVGRAVESLAMDYVREGRPDYVRVLYGRLCEELTIADVAAALELKPATVDNYYRHARERLSQELADLVRQQLEHYCEREELEAEFEREWHELGRHLAEHGGLDMAVRRAHELLDPPQAGQRRQAGIDKAVKKLTAIMHASGETSSSGTEG
ncbi:MAG: sigma-70 family RNA polymerase sigma factor [Pirellulales bacterium]